MTRHLPKKVTAKDFEKIEMNDLENTVLNALGNGEGRTVKDLRFHNKIIDDLSVQKLSAILRKLTENGFVVKETCSKESVYYSVSALYNSMLKLYKNQNSTVEDIEKAVEGFGRIQFFESSKSYLQKSKDKLKDLRYELANKKMKDAKTLKEFEEVAELYERLGTYKNSQECLKTVKSKIIDIVEWIKIKSYYGITDLSKEDIFRYRLFLVLSFIPIVGVFFCNQCIPKL